MFSFLSRLSSTETFSHFYTLTFLINMFYLKAFSSVSWWDASFWYFFLKQSVIFHIFTFCVKSESEGFLFLSFSAGLDPLWFWSLELFSSVTFWHLYLWESETGSGSSSGLIAAEFSYFQTPLLFYFILFPLVFYICPFGANILKVSFHQQLHVTLKVLGSLWYLFNILKTNSTTNIRRRFMFLKFGTKTF